MKKISFFDHPSFSQRVSLDSREYLLRFTWNSRDVGWYLSILTVQGEMVLDSVRLVLGFDLLLNRVSPLLPAGSLLCVAVNPVVTEISYDSFTAGEAELIFVSGAEYALL